MRQSALIRILMTLVMLAFLTTESFGVVIEADSEADAEFFRRLRFGAQDGVSRG